MNKMSYAYFSCDMMNICSGKSLFTVNCMQKAGVNVNLSPVKGNARHLLMLRNFRIFPQILLFGRLQNGSPPFTMWTASHSSHSVYRSQVFFGQGQSLRMVGGISVPH